MVFVVCVWENKIGRPAQLDKIPGIGYKKKGQASPPALAFGLQEIKIRLGQSPSLQ
jgi:hypothetical protein